MKLYRGTIELQSKDHRPDFHNVTEEIKKNSGRIGSEKWDMHSLFTSYHLFDHYPGVLTRFELFRSRIFTTGFN